MRNRLKTLQALRAFAAMAVVFYHTIAATDHAYPDGTIPDSLMNIGWLGGFGVDVFFVISGFIMMYAHWGDFQLPGSQRSFWSNRLRRIVPNYWLLTTVGVLIILLMPSLSQHGRTFDPYWIIASYAFIPWTSDSGITMPVLGLGWTLNYEMYFYVVFSFALLFPRNLAIPLLVLVFLTSIAAGTFISSDAPLFKQVTSWLLIEFLCGVALAIAFKKGRSVQTSTAVLLVAITFPLLAMALLWRDNGAFPHYLRLVFYGTPALAIVLAATLSEGMRNLRVPAFIILLGDASYSIYLTHLFTLPATLKILPVLGIELYFLLNIVVLVVASAVVGVIFYKLFEHPTQKMLRPTKQLSARQ